MAEAAGPSWGGGGWLPGKGEPQQQVREWTVSPSQSSLGPGAQLSLLSISGPFFAE